MLTTLELITTIDGKHLFGSLFGKGSIVMICAIVGVAILAAIVIYLQKNKKGNNGETEDE